MEQKLTVQNALHINAYITAAGVREDIAEGVIALPRFASEWKIALVRIMSEITAQLLYPGWKSPGDTAVLIELFPREVVGSTPLRCPADEGVHQQLATHYLTWYRSNLPEDLASGEATSIEG